ncbi:MAG: tRNA (adenosine(37)-N6)-dimethylallyltransferase MiaA [Opitutales bacterium]
MTQKLHIITGPTAVGKTEFALSYAESRDAEIVSCDASLVYRGMDIGTAKPEAAELARVPHHLIDLCEVDTRFDIVSYVRAAQAAVRGIVNRGREVVVTGGSGFYLKSFFAPVFDSVEVPDSVREQVRRLQEDSGLEGLLAALRRISPDTGRLDTRNPRRVVRALERCLASGKDVPRLEAEFAARPEPYAAFEKKLILLERNTEELRGRVERRARQMVERGLIEEVKELLDRGIEQNPSAASAIGYRESIAVLEGHLPRADLVQTIAANTMRLVKKQRTWFRTQIRPADQVLQL